MTFHEGDATWTLGVLILLPVIAVVAIAILVLGGIIFGSGRRERDGELKALGGAFFVVSALVVVIAAAAYYPWKAEYHQYVTKVGTVAKISSRILGSSDSFQQKFVVRFTDGRQFGCEDTRCALVKPGDTLALACKRTWQYTGTDGYDCNFLGTEPKA